MCTYTILFWALCVDHNLKMDGTAATSSFTNSLHRLVDKILRDRPSGDEIFEFAEKFFVCEKTENAKLSHALHSLKYHVKNPTEFDQIASDLFDILLTKPVCTHMVQMKAALQLSRSILQNEYQLDEDDEDKILTTLFSSDSEIGFDKFRSLLRLTFLVGDMRSWLAQIYPFLRFDIDSRHVHIDSQYTEFCRSKQGIALVAPTSVRTSEDEAKLLRQLRSLVETGCISPNDVKNVDSFSSIILHNLCRKFCDQVIQENL